MSRLFGADEIDPLALGAWILGTGGGGSPYLAQLGLHQLYAQGRQCRLIDPEELGDGDMVAVLSQMGAPLVGQERLVDAEQLARAVTMMEEYLGCRFAAVMPLEIGGANALAPFLAGAVLDLPVVDADSMGRAFPEAQMTSFAIGGLKMYPLSIVDCRGIEGIVARVPSWKWMERLSRAMCTEMGSTAATCKAPRSGAEIKQWSIRNTVTQAVGIGLCVMAAREVHQDPVEALLDHTGGKRIFSGKVLDVDRETTGGFLRGKAMIGPLAEGTTPPMELCFQNEWIVAFHDGQALATTPDLICLIDTESGEAVGTETVRYGQRVALVALPAPAVLCTEAGLAHVGPRAFGYDLDYRSVFDT